MITIETAAKKAAGLLSASTLLASAYASAVISFVRRWQTYRELSALDDRTLHDIGLDRSMIASVALQGGRTAR